MTSATASAAAIGEEGPVVPEGRAPSRFAELERLLEERLVENPREWEWTDRRKQLKTVVDPAERRVGRARIGDAHRDDDGFLVHEVESEYQAGKTQIRVLLPDRLKEGHRYPVVYTLPVLKLNANRYGTGLKELKKIDAHNRHDIICVTPTFSQMPWYADHPTDPSIRQETHFLDVVVPMVDRTYPVIARPDGRLLLGYSKGGWGAFSLLMRHPEVFERAVAWDAPLTKPGPDAAAIFGSEENAEQYQVTSLIERRSTQFQDRERLILIGYDTFRRDHRAFHAQLERLNVPHHYRDGPRQKHHWHSGWVSEAVRLLVSPARSP